MKENGFFDDAYTIIDANLNRAKEGLRVCEDIARFHLKSAAATKALGRLRHEITNTVKKINTPNQRSHSHPGYRR